MPRPPRYAGSKEQDPAYGVYCQLESYGRILRPASTNTLVSTKCQKNIARRAAEPHIAGIDEDHAVDDHRARAIDRTAAALHAVHCLVVLHGVEVPEDRSVASRVRTQVAILRPGEHDTGHGCERCQLRGAAIRPRSTRWRRRVPRLAAVGDLECRQPAALSRIELTRSRRANDHHIRGRGVDLLTIEIGRA